MIYFTLSSTNFLVFCFDTKEEKVKSDLFLTFFLNCCQSVFKIRCLFDHLFKTLKQQLPLRPSHISDIWLHRSEKFYEILKQCNTRSFQAWKFPGKRRNSSFFLLSKFLHFPSFSGHFGTDNISCYFSPSYSYAWFLIPLRMFCDFLTRFPAFFSQSFLCLIFHLL